ncbi:DUF368 family protein [Natronomonas pharaonis DSM 2160]|uniref:DUF368 family protein n=1 Tax=Natronomonas pharaonis (strain ATCC 35678 / DSM 2160 / CIP 103997 / JCM 8858 / NBRC 14720 / NCIMB 2260 / Gabara) TaxID=348780 RepID=A0A1U7EXM5_NATPD|nr:DUF368 domain-containing protein [Natronomonas pharaonis]CAI49952.1 DUF368 family protein [Natronomonas pharaonis DSM 2160]
MSATPTGARAWLAVYLKGVCMGAADTVPGVSGGTIAVVLGIYERLIAALTSLDPKAATTLREIHTANGRARLAAELVRMDVPFLLVLGAGVLSAAATVATAMNVAVTQYPAPTYAFFFGLIAASAVVLYRYVDAGTPGRLLAAGVGFVFAFVVTDPSLAGDMPATAPMLFVAGAIAVSAMVLPGVSGAFLLLVLGQYEYVSGIPRRFVEGLLSGGGETFIEAAVAFGVFLGGALVGLFTVAYAVRAALKRYRQATLVFLVSLMVGALRLPVHEMAVGVETRPFDMAVLGIDTVPTPRSGAIVAVAAALGVAAVMVLDRYTEDLQY